MNIMMVVFMTDDIELAMCYVTLLKVQIMCMKNKSSESFQMTTNPCQNRPKTSRNQLQIQLHCVQKIDNPLSYS